MTDKTLHRNIRTPLVALRMPSPEALQELKSQAVLAGSTSTSEYLRTLVAEDKRRLEEVATRDK